MSGTRRTAPKLWDGAMESPSNVSFLRNEALFDIMRLPLLHDSIHRFAVGSEETLDASIEIGEQLRERARAAREARKAQHGRDVLRVAHAHGRDRVRERPRRIALGIEDRIHMRD